MPKLTIISGGEAGRIFELQNGETVLGRGSGVAIKLNDTNISRCHARFVREGKDWHVEDLRSSNGTFLNGTRITSRCLLKPRDEIRVGAYVLVFDEGVEVSEMTIRARTAADAKNAELFRENTGQKLQVILQLAHEFGRSLDPGELLNGLVGHLFELFPKAERALVVEMENEAGRVRASRERSGKAAPESFSKSALRVVVNEGVGVVAEDAQQDARFNAAQSIVSLGVQSFMCVPLKRKNQQVMGAIQLDRFGVGSGFTREDLHLLTAIGLLVSPVLENAQLHIERVHQERLERDLALAREIQRSYLPSRAPELPDESFDLHAELTPAHEVSGDFYDYFRVGAESLGFVVADVSGKGMPAALFMSSVRVLLRQFAAGGGSAGEILQRLNNALADDNPRCLFVTVALGIYNPASGVLQVAAGGHPPGLLRRAEGEVIELDGAAGPLLGFDSFGEPMQTSQVQLGSGDLVVFYTDGLTEAAAPGAGMFGVERLKECVRSCGTERPLEDAARVIRQAVSDHAQRSNMEDDLTLVLIRRR